MENPHRQADVADRDSRGNTVLHTLVVIADDTTDNTDMIAGIYDQILIQHFKSEAKTVPLEAIENNQGLTPLKLAAKLGKIGVCLISTQCLFLFMQTWRQPHPPSPAHVVMSVVWVGGTRRAASIFCGFNPHGHFCYFPPLFLGQLFRHILHREITDARMRSLSRKFTEWVYGPVRSSLYDTGSIDTDQQNSVLEIVIFGNDVPVSSPFNVANQKMMWEVLLKVCGCHWTCSGFFDDVWLHLQEASSSPAAGRYL